MTDSTHTHPPRREEDRITERFAKRSAKYLPVFGLLTGLAMVGSAGVFAAQWLGWKGQAPASVVAAVESTVVKVGERAHTENRALRTYVDSGLTMMTAQDSTLGQAVTTLRRELREVQSNDAGQTALLCVIADGIDPRLVQVARVDCESLLRQRQRGGP